MENTNLTSIDGIRLEAVVHPAQVMPSMGTVCDHGFGSCERQDEVIGLTASWLQRIHKQDLSSRH